MKRFFDEPSVCVERFAVGDELLFLSGVTLGENELDAIGVPAIESRE